MAFCCPLAKELSRISCCRTPCFLALLNAPCLWLRSIVFGQVAFIIPRQFASRCRGNSRASIPRGGRPFAFIAITNASYVGIPKEASNQVAGIINFVRNVGGSIFIAITGAIVTNRAMTRARLRRLLRLHLPRARMNGMTA